MFSRFIALSRLPYHLDDWILGIHACFRRVPYRSRLLCVLGCIMDITSISSSPSRRCSAAAGFGFDRYMLVILLVFIGEMAGLTPPMGVNVFAVACALRVDPGKIFQGILAVLPGGIRRRHCSRRRAGDRDLHLQLGGVTTFVREWESHRANAAGSGG